MSGSKPNAPLSQNTIEEVDVLIFGAGAGGMSAALIAKLEGLEVLLCEKTTQVGGITATSGGTTWVPGTSLSVAAGVADSAKDAEKFLKAIIGNRGGEAKRLAFLRSGASAIDDFTQKTEVQFVASKAHPDYLDGDGAAFGGRALSPLPFDGRLLGKDFERVRPPRPEFMGLGGMMVGRDELDIILNRFKSLANLKTTLKIVSRYFKDRLRFSRGTRVLMGNALVARLFFSLKQQGCMPEFEHSLKELIRENSRIIGAKVATPNGIRIIHARKGVVLATGGIANNKELRQSLYPEGTRVQCLAPLSNNGDGVDNAIKIGARLDDGCDSPALWMPCSFHKKPNGEMAVWPHIILDRAKPGLLAVNQKGERFVNESNSYHDFCMGALQSNKMVPTIPAYLIVDDAFIHQYGLGLVLPGGVGLNRLIQSGYIIKADTLAALAQKINVDPQGLINTVKQYDDDALTGIDQAFGRGSSVMNRFNGDKDNKPNPCMRVLGKGPFYAVSVRPYDLASSGGIDCDEFGRVVDNDQKPIEGLFACGNDATSIFRGTYPGPGTTLGPAMVFGWRIGKYLAGSLKD
ncbi:FAD-binding protein [Bartonella sp. HY329]|uniref:FAD-binding protein n=1 Tax=unclassified Bartonella TaxID=2645622 RepID=UPI0021C603DD|nr:MULTISPECIES: FAD-binding protein [unclassified Bartonella]UXM95377.1 FAD-binding protein [Bartonella sp. HY329]UXN09702.1 FAD-binding protein [Bartonella sp. HY328]